jgi:polysaccharide deacetylase
MTPRVPFAERGGPVRGLVDLVTGCYPAFLFGGSVDRALPVFHFHDVTRESFEPQLQYLVDNRYRTVSSDEIARLVIDGISPGPQTVGLTFDDGWASVWTVATPLLRRFDLRAILFAIPGRISDAPIVRPTIDDRALAANPRSTESPFVTWSELRAMHQSGIIDVQSHTRTHAMIFSDQRATGFVTPEYSREPFLNRPVAASNGHLSFVEPEALGTPLYLPRSRMSDARRFVADSESAERCREHVARNGGAAFFGRAGWRQELDVLAAAGKGVFEDDKTRAAWIHGELIEGRALLNDGLGTSTVRHVALPWGIAGQIARRALADTGHGVAFAQRPLKRLGIRAGDDRYELTRLNGKFVTCLPGRGRKWFLSA